MTFIKIFETNVTSKKKKKIPQDIMDKATTDIQINHGLNANIAIYICIWLYLLKK